MVTEKSMLQITENKIQWIKVIHGLILSLEHNDLGPEQSKEMLWLEIGEYLASGLHKEFTSLLIQRLVDRGFGREFYQFWNPLSLSECQLPNNAIELFLKLETEKTYRSSEEFSDAMVRLFGVTMNDFTIQKFVNFDAIRNMNLSRVKVDGIVIWTSRLENDHICHTLGLLDNLLTVWGHSKFVIEAPIEYVERVAVGIVSSLRVLGAITYPRKHIEKFLNSVPKYLESTREVVRLTGLVVSQICSKRLTPSQSLSLLDSTPFELQFLENLFESPLEDTISCSNQLETKQSPVLIPYFKNSDVEVKRPERIYFQPKNVKDQTPRFLKQCLELLKKREPESVELSLCHLVHVINKASQMEIQEHCKDLCYILVYLQDEYEIDGFDSHVCNSLIALALLDDACGYHLPFYFCQKQITQTSQFRVLRLLVCIPMLFLQVIFNNAETKSTKIGD
jgi:hypothetical protein